MKLKLRRDLLVLLFFTALAVLMTWPLITQIGSVYAGNNEDLWTFQWDNWWIRYALQHGYNLLFTPVQFYPIGVSLAAHSLSFYNSLLWIPLAALFGDIAAYNLTVLLTFILSGYTMFLLVDYLITRPDAGSKTQDAQSKSEIRNQESRIAALSAGIIFAFAPYHFSQSLGHVSLASVQWFPLLALFILKATRETKRRNFVWIGLTTLLITATRLQFLVLGGIVFAIFVLVDWLVLRREWTRGAWTRLIVGATLGLLLSLPILLPAASLFTQAATPDELIADEQTWGQTDLAAYFVPMTYHPLLGPIVLPLYENFVKNRAWMPYLGIVPLLLAGWGAWRQKRRALPWIAIGVFSFVMALGPFLRVNGVDINLPLPYALIGDKFPLNTLRSPDRYNLMLSLALAPLAAWGVIDLLARVKARAERKSQTIRPRQVVYVTGLVIGVVILFEYLGVPYPTMPPLPTSPFQEQLAQDPENYAVLDIPLDRSDTKRYLYYQTQHQKSTVQGRVARVPAEAYALFEQIPLLTAWAKSMGAKRPPDVGAQLRQLAERNVRYIILHKDLTQPEAITSLRNYFTLPPVYEDDQIAVYSTTLAAQPAPMIGNGLGLINSWVGIEGLDKPIRARVRWTTTQPIGRDYDYRLELIDEQGAVVISQTDRLVPASSSWQPGTIVMGDYQLLPQQPVRIGRYRLQLSVLDGDHIIGSVDLPHRIINEPVRDNGQWLMVVSQEPHVRFGDAIELRAADVSRRGNWLSLWLHWYALQAPGVDTKYFVHLLDADGNVVAQDDGIYVKYTRPSSEWQADEMISDLIEMPLWNLTPGEYRIAVGLTNPDTSERIPAIDESGQALPENRYLFSETIRID